MSIMRAWLTLAVSLCSISSDLIAADLLVPSEFPTIQSAVDAAATGDRVLVSPGTYEDSIVVDKGLELLAAGSVDEVILESTQYDRLITVEVTDGAVVTISGFTIQGQAPNVGAGIFLNSAAVIENNRFMNLYSGLGGAIATHADATGVIRNNHFEGNRGDLAGGAILTIAPMRIEHNTFINNNGGGWDTVGAAGAIYLVHEDAVVSDCLFVENGPDTMTLNAGRVINCTIIATYSAFACESDGSGTITNCIVTGYNEFQGTHLFGGGDPGILTVEHSILSSAETGVGLLQVDPLFTDPVVGDFTLLADSPAINGGVERPSELPVVDILGNPRVSCGVVDLGCFESEEPVGGCTNHFLRGDCNIDGRVDTADAVSLLTLLFGGGSASCFDACDVNDDGGLNVADPIMLLGYLFSTSPIPPSISLECDPDVTPDLLGCVDYPGC